VEFVEDADLPDGSCKVPDEVSVKASSLLEHVMRKKQASYSVPSIAPSLSLTAGFVLTTCRLRLTAGHARAKAPPIRWLWFTGYALAARFGMVKLCIQR